ncbi:STE-domain-containing protein [Xylona heveae TC161]|uniref:STE-domain-containing protein n=1 Tax=Xylona heveae (strain CBS 132557 / TC161) TaxID=1328760 RepID=A0A165GSX7_XYLHT|nr:STE-domain-containing protein [Xylona heveae TC161]KZF22557.1 STE-domain-containing protein [Xylona heveae TC161]
MTTTQKPETFMLSSEAQQSLPQDAQVALQQVDNLKYFLISAPVDWAPDQYIRRFLLPTGEYVSCVLWNNLFHVSGTDIVRCLSFRFQAFGRPVKNSKKFEEGIFSDLRNLKAGTDASLEEPKSPFLDFLYKNNCIRTQKKQKVFYWYSVPHDRLFLDALERDLKREKMSQEPTTVAVNEPALSFEFDSSQSLFEQLTKAQQANTSSFAAAAAAAAATTNAAVAVNYSQSNSPVMRAMDSMPPPPTVPQPMGALVPDDVHQMAIYTAAPLPMSAALPHGHLVKRELDGMALSRAQPRHASMPAYMEYSPAPSFVSSHYEDYSNRGVSFEPLTPPQQPMPLGAEPAYIANEDTGLYTAIPDVGASTAYGNMVQLPPSNLAGSQYGGIRTFGGGVPANNPYGMLEGSPTYKQRRRRSPGMGMGMGMVAVGGSVVNPHAPLRPSDLRRSVSSSVVPMPDGIESMRASPQVQPNHYAGMAQPKELIDLSRNTTPMPTLEASPAPIGLMQPHGDLSHVSCAPGAELEHPVHSSPAIRPMPGVLRRARSATITDMGPYPHKSHSCPIPSCGRLFKRLEHLKRHVRTHTQERPYICKTCNKGFSRSDNLAQYALSFPDSFCGRSRANTSFKAPSHS